MKTLNSIEEYIGNTPIIRLLKIEQKLNIKNKIYAKLEMLNPSGSVKARVAKEMISSALEHYIITKSSTVIEPTSGNTGIALAMICATLGMRFIAVMPQNVSPERQKLIKAYGGEVILTSSKLGMNGAIMKALEIRDEVGGYIPSQFENKLNPLTHYKTTGKEIYDDLDGNIDIVISTIGTGGTISGCSKYIKEKKPIITIGIEPSESPLITKGYVGSHKIEGIGPNFISKVLNLKYVDKVICVSYEESLEFARMLAKEEGLFVGISSGATLAGCVKYLKEHKVENKDVVIILPDGGERYLSGELIEL